MHPPAHEKSMSTTLLVLFIPSHDRYARAIDQERWTEESLGVLGTLFKGATAYPKGKGVWRDDEQGGKLLFDTPVVIQCYTSETMLDKHADAVRAHLTRMGVETRQGAIGFVIDNGYYEIAFPIEPATDAH